MKKKGKSSQTRKNARKATGDKPGGNRFEKLINLQMRAINHWGDYAQNAAKLMTKGSLHPAPWMKQYTDLSGKMVNDLGELVRIIAGNR